MHTQGEEHYMKVTVVPTKHNERNHQYPESPLWGGRRGIRSTSVNILIYSSLGESASVYRWAAGYA